MIRSFTKSERRGCAERSSQWPRGAVRPIRLAPLRRHHQPIPTNACGTGWAGETGNVRSGANLLHGAAGQDRSPSTLRAGRSPATRHPSIPSSHEDRPPKGPVYNAPPGCRAPGRDKRGTSIPELPAVTSGGKGPCVRPADLDRLNLPDLAGCFRASGHFWKPQSFASPRGDISLPACIRARLTHRPSTSCPVPSVERQESTGHVRRVGKVVRKTGNLGGDRVQRRA